MGDDDEQWDAIIEQLPVDAKPFDPMLEIEEPFVRVSGVRITRELLMLLEMFLDAKAAAKQLGIGRDKFRKVCRKFGIVRWKHPNRRAIVGLWQ